MFSHGFLYNYYYSNRMNHVILFGEYLLRLTPPQPQKLVQAAALEMHWAGSEANIGVSLSLLGDAATYVTAMPSNALAQAGVAQLHKFNLHTHIHWKSSGRTGLYFYESGLGMRGGEVLYDRDHSAFSLLQTGELDWNAMLQNGDWFHWSGITPALNKNLAHVCLEGIKAAKENGLTISADFNYRSTLWKYGAHSAEVMPELLAYCDVVLADVDTAKIYFGITPDADDVVESTCRQLQQKLPGATYIALTMRQQSSDGNTYTGYLWHRGSLTSSKAYPINAVAERIGTGDAFMAGLIYALRQKKSDPEVIAFATACGAIKHTFIGDFNLATGEDIKRLQDQNGAAKLIR